MNVYIKLWWKWAMNCYNSWPYKILVLFKLAKSPTFESIKAFRSWEVEK